MENMSRKERAMKRRSRMQRTVWLGTILAITINGVVVWPGDMGLAPAPVRYRWLTRRRQVQQR